MATTSSTNTVEQTKSSHLHFPYQSIQFIADSNQCQHLSDESMKYLTLEATGTVRFLLQVNHWEIIEHRIIL
jgi:hypothetical protein